MIDLRKSLSKFFFGFLFVSIIVIGMQYLYANNKLMFEGNFHYGVDSIRGFIMRNVNRTLWRTGDHGDHAHDSSFNLSAVNTSTSSVANNKGSIMSTLSRTSITRIIVNASTSTKVIVTTASVAITTATTTVTTTKKPESGSNLPLCPLVPPKLVGPLAIHLQVGSFEELEKLHSAVQPGGWWKPSDCTSRHRVAIVVPYRERPEQLRVFLHHMHPMLQRQQLNYGIFIVEPAMPVTFNRGMLMNVGFVEASKLYDWQCYVFHDVDLYPENDKNIYSCPEFPRHMTPAVDKFGYKLPYGGIFGGGSAFKKEHFEKINGFSNKYFGWGGEDDDLMKRVLNRGLKVIRYPMDIARYKMFRHAHEKSNAVNPQRFALLNTAGQRQPRDGLNTMRYKVLKVEKRKLYTWVNVQIDQNEVMKT